MARKLVIEIVGDASSYERALVSANRGTQKFSRELSHAGRGAISGSRIFSGLGRSLAFASGGFIAFQSVTAFLRDSIDAAREAAVAQRSLAAQMKASGESFAAHRDQIEKTVQEYAKFGFNNDQVIQSLTVLERGTGHVNTAIRLQGLTADIARAKNIDLSAAANIVAKVFGRQETALRRAVPGLAKNAHGWDLIRLAQQKMAGQAAANTTVAERFSATLHNTEVIIGDQLLPVINKYLDRLSKLLQKWNESPQAQKKFHDDVKSGTDALSGLADMAGVAFKALTGLYGLKHKVADSLGGIGHYLFAGPVAGFEAFFKSGNKAISTLSDFLGLSSKAAGKVTSQAMMRVGGGPDLGHPVPTTAAAAAAAGGLLGPAPAFQDQISRALNRLQFRPLQGQLARLRQLEAIIRSRMRHARTIRGLLALEDTLWQIIGQEKTVRQQIVQNAIAALQLGIDRAGLTTGLSDDLAALHKLEAYLKARIKVTKDSLDLQSQLVGVQGQILQVQAQQAQQRKEAAQKAAAAAAARREAAQFRALGLGPGGEALVPRAAALVTQVKRVREQIRGTILDTPKEERLLDRMLLVLEGHWGKVTKAVRQQIQQMIQGIRQDLGKGQGELTRWRHTSVAQIVSGLGLDPRQAEALSSRLATVGPGMTVHPHRAGAFAAAGGTVITGNTMHFHGVQDVAGLERQLTKRQAARPHNRRGAH